MAVEFITTDQTTPYNIDNTDQVFLSAGVTMTGTLDIFTSIGLTTIA